MVVWGEGWLWDLELKCRTKSLLKYEDDLKNEDNPKNKGDRMGDVTITLQKVFTYSHGIFSYAVALLLYGFPN